MFLSTHSVKSGIASRMATRGDTHQVANHSSVCKANPNQTSRLFIAFSRERYRQFNQFLDQELGNRRALVLIHHDPTDLHIDYLHNQPTWDAQILRGRADDGKPDAQRTAELKQTFPDRELWYFDVVTGKLEKLD